jgi:hypothetical protein
VTGNFYLSFNSSAGWIHPVVNRLNSTLNEGLRERYIRHWPGKEGLGKLAVTVEAKLSKLPASIRVVDKDVRLLDSELTERENEVDECIRRKSALILRNEDLGLSLSANIESFLYHSRSAYELVTRFLITFSRSRIALC